MGMGSHGHHQPSDECTGSGMLTSSRLQYPIFLLPSTLVRTKEKVSLQGETTHGNRMALPAHSPQGCDGMGWETMAETPQQGRYLVNSVTGAQLLPSGKQKRGMACKRRSSSSFWPFSKFSRWNKAMTRVRVMEGDHSPRGWGGVGHKATLSSDESRGCPHIPGQASPKNPIFDSFTPGIVGQSRGT